MCICNRTERTNATWFLRSLLLLIAPTFASVGCNAPSFLITPVTSSRNLVETVLQKETLFGGQKIVLIDVSGVLMNSERSQFFSRGEHPVSLLLEQLDKARRDAAVKAVILRINSPGGSVVASELMYDEVRYFKKKTGKPVVALMMDVAASGGYYIACACDEIVAQPSTVTGSIGVIMQLFDVSNTMSKIGVKSEAITSGAMKDAGSPFRQMLPVERALFQDIVNDMYERFVKVVAAGRPNLNEAQVRKLADGRVYTASQAKAVGLIDDIRTLRDTIRQLKTRIGAEKIRLVTYHRPADHKPNYYASAPRHAGVDVNLLKLDLSDWANLGTPGFMYLWQPGF